MCEQWGGRYIQNRGGQVVQQLRYLFLSLDEKGKSETCTNTSFSCQFLSHLFPFFLLLHPLSLCSPVSSPHDRTAAALRAHLSLLRPHRRACSCRLSFTGRVRILDYRSMCFDRYGSRRPDLQAKPKQAHFACAFYCLKPWSLRPCPPYSSTVDKATKAASHCANPGSHPCIPGPTLALPWYALPCRQRPPACCLLFPPCPLLPLLVLHSSLTH